MRSILLPILVLLAGCARPVTQPDSPTPMAAGCPMIQGQGAHAMPGMAMATPTDSSAAHACPCPMHAAGHAMHSSTGVPAPAGADSSRSMPGCPMCASGRCPMHPAATPPTGAAHH